MNKLLRYTGAGVLALALASSTGSRAQAPPNTSAPPPAEPQVNPYLSSDVDGAIAYFQNWRPAEASLFSTAYGYAVFPRVVNFAFIIGGAGGSGEVFEHGQLIGTCNMGLGSIGAQIGGQELTEYIFFQNRYALEDFEHNPAAFSARASAVAAIAGAGTAANYEHGVIVYIRPKVGLMVQAAIGGQQFEFYPLPH